MPFFSVLLFYPYGPEFILGSFHTLGGGQCKISKDPTFCHNLVTAPSCFKLNSPMLGQPVWRDVLETLRGLSKKFGQDGQLETGSDDLK